MLEHLLGQMLGHVLKHVPKYLLNHVAKHVSGHVARHLPKPVLKGMALPIGACCSDDLAAVHAVLLVGLRPISKPNQIFLWNYN